MRVVHYLNQFFGGLGGEEQAGMLLEIREGAIGPGLLVHALYFVAMGMLGVWIASRRLGHLLLT